MNPIAHTLLGAISTADKVALLSKLPVAQLLKLDALRNVLAEETIEHYRNLADSGEVSTIADLKQSDLLGLLVEASINFLNRSEQAMEADVQPDMVVRCALCGGFTRPRHSRVINQ